MKTKNFFIVLAGIFAVIMCVLILILMIAFFFHNQTIIKSDTTPTQMVTAIPTPTAIATEVPTPTPMPTIKPTPKTTPKPTIKPVTKTTYKPTTKPKVKKPIKKKVYVTPKPVVILPENKVKAINTYSYGTSGKNRNLSYTAFEVKKPTKKVLIVFELHGFEDSYAKDGQKLVNIGNAVISYFKAHPSELYNCSLYIVSSANPDGLAEGTTNNGPGRCQVSLGVDLNRDFDINWAKRTNARNKTLAPFSAPESRALRDLVIKIRPTDVVDVHGWLKTTYGTSSLCKPFQNAFGIGRTSGLSGWSGYFASWATLYAPRTALVELPSPNASQSKMISAIKSVCYV